MGFFLPLKWELMTDGHSLIAAVWRSLFMKTNDPYETVALLTPRGAHTDVAGSA